MNLRKHIKKLSTLSLSVAAAAILWLALSTGDSAPTTLAQTGDTPTPVPTLTQPEGSGIQNLPPIKGKLNPPQYPNMDSNLNRIVEQAQSGQFTARAAAANAPIHDGASVAVTLYITEGYADAISDYLITNGASPRNIGVDYIEAYVPVALLTDASQQEGVISVQTIIPPEPAQGAVVSQGAAVHGVPAWHAEGYRGQGVKIGVIDGGFQGFQTLVANGELPSSVTARCYTEVGVYTSNLADCTSYVGVHGAAVTETIFDISPQATYYIADPLSAGDLKTAVDWMVSQGVNVINMSLGWRWDGPGDGTSPFTDSPLRSVDTAVNGGITWVNAAGNSAVDTWYGQFTDADNDLFHNFSGNVECNEIEVDDTFDISIRAELRWDDNWSGASRDIDLYLYRESPVTGDLVRITSDAFGHIGGTYIQDGSAYSDPYESIFYLNPPTGTYCLAVRSIDGTTPSWVQLRVKSQQELSYHSLNGSIINPAESANSGLLAVGAAPWNNPNVIDYYSSRGPTPDDRIKPDIVGASNTTSVSYNTPFPGTSASSPHVAGLAALVKQRFPDYHPTDITSYLKSNAERRGAVPNNTWGYGFAKLPASSAPQPTPVPSITPTATPVTAPTVPPEVLNRISRLETLVATLQGLIATLQSAITTLDSRVTALETNASAPTPIPTATATVTFTPTPTFVPGAPTPVPTPVPTETPVPTATPITNACVTSITQGDVISASWISGCESTNRPKDPDADSGTYYARYYTFDITTPSTVTITLASSEEDTFLYLLNGKGKTGSVAYSNDDIEYRVNTNSRIEQTLEVGSYTIEAATYDSGTVGSSFTLTVSGIK